jgi:hypothetical protein
VAGLPPVAGTYWNTLPFPLAVLRRKVLPPRSAASDVHLYNGTLEAIFNRMMGLERRWLAAGGGLPFGASMLVVGLKPAGAMADGRD